MAKNTRLQKRKRRQVHIRKKVIGTSQRPRLNVFRSNNETYAQLVDDTTGNTLVHASSLDKKIKKELEGKRSIEAARRIGAEVAQRALDTGIKKVVFDRAGYRYHGRVKALAEGAREAGLEF